MSKAVLDAITIAFPPVEAIDSPVVSCPCPECAEIVADFQGVPWHQLSHDLVLEHYTSLPLLSSQAFEHFLPAYLIDAVTFPDTALGEMLIYALASPREYANPPRFTTQQGRAVIAFAEWYAALDGDFAHELQQIRSHWGP